MSAHFSGIRKVLPAQNEPIRSYAPGSPEKASLKARLASMAGETIDIPLIIGGKEIRTGDLGKAVMPHKHGHVLATYHHARPKDVVAAMAAAKAAKAEWASWPWEDRAAVFLKAADLLATTWRDTLNAATMLNQSKTVYQSEIDAACELVDFWRFNVGFAADLMAEQPLSTTSMWNQTDYRPLEGVIYAVSPFNFTAIGGNLTSTPALMGNTVVWKPAATAMLGAYYTMKLLEAAGLPPGVINFVPGDPVAVSDVVMNSPDLGGIHFTGSTGVFQNMWAHVGANIRNYKSYPRLVGETGGKDFIMVHPSADPQEVAVAMVRGAYEYQGQKCSAASRVYVPKSLWPEVRDRAVAMMREITIGDTRDFRNFMSAVIDKKAFTKISGYIAHAKRNARVIQGGGCNGRVGYFVEPTLVQTDNPAYKLMCEEIFGPVLTAHPYADSKFAEMLQVVDRTSPYALTGSIFAKDRAAVKQASAALRNAAGNFYINDKPTGATVGQQPFGGARGSGTNDKAGSKMNLLRWVSARSIKETYNPPTSYTYPFMGEE
jgi:1-pyrroline-5-carboxylate dehydrogenase